MKFHSQLEVFKKNIYKKSRATIVTLLPVLTCQWYYFTNTLFTLTLFSVLISKK